MSFILTKEMLREFAPKAKSGAELHKAMEKILPKYDIDTPNRIAMFLAQCGHESGGFRLIEENLNYSAKALDAVFGKYFARAGRDAKAYARKPEKIANIVYASRMGNGDTDSGDGWRYRGRGYIQLTGKNNYDSFASDIGVSTTSVVEYLETIEGALESACWFWKENGLNRYADDQDIRGATKRINGGYNGLEDREHHYHQALALLGGQATHKPAKSSSSHQTLRIGMRGPEVARMQKALRLRPDGNFGKRTAKRVRDFQQANGLTPDGVAGPKTLKKLYG